MSTKTLTQNNESPKVPNSMEIAPLKKTKRSCCGSKLNDKKNPVTHIMNELVNFFYFCLWQGQSL